MTNLIIHPDTTLRRDYLMEQVNTLLGRSYSQVPQLFQNPDIHIIEGTEHTAIGIDEIKKLQHEMIFRPFEESYQLGIIFHAQNLTSEAQNALLKTLEDESEYNVYYLLVDNVSNLLDTILSRSIKHYVKGAQTDTEKEAGAIEQPLIIMKPLDEKFKEIEELVEIEKENKNAVRDFLHTLALYYQKQLREMIRNNDPNFINQAKILNEILTAQYRITVNVNKRLAAENVILKIEELG